MYGWGMNGWNAASNFGVNLPGGFFLFLITLWALAWKGWALWKAAKDNSRPWFIALLLINTLGILEILYIYVFSKKPKSLK